MSIGRIGYQLAYQISPIFLVNGIADLYGVGGLLPIVTITQMVSTAQEALNVITGSDKPMDLLNPDKFFAHFNPMAGGNLHSNQVGQYPFANQKVAANAIIAQPLHISMRMTCHPKIKGGAVSQLLSGAAIKLAIDKHNFSGGMYHVLTPHFLYMNCIMTEMKDITPGNSEFPQVEWQLDFLQPLITKSDATDSLNSLAKKLSAGVPI